jgi:hypothetical protein
VEAHLLVELLVPAAHVHSAVRRMA